MQYIALQKYKEWQSAVSVGEVSSLTRTRSSRPHLRWTRPGLPLSQPRLSLSSSHLTQLAFRLTSSRLILPRSPLLSWSKRQTSRPSSQQSCRPSSQLPCRPSSQLPSRYPIVLQVIPSSFRPLLTSQPMLLCRRSLHQ